MPPPPRIQSTASISDANNSIQTEKKLLDTKILESAVGINSEQTAARQQTQQQPEMTTPIERSHNITPPVSGFGSQRQETQLERPPITPSRPSMNLEARRDHGGMEKPLIDIPSRPGVDATYRQPPNVRPPGTFHAQAPWHDPRTGPPPAGPNHRPYLNRSPSAAYRQPPPRRQQALPTLTQLWKKVERGLDGLADLEDVVTERAQQLYSTAKESVSSVYKRPLDGRSADNDHDIASSVAVPSVRIWSKSRSSKPASTPIPQMDMSRFTKKIATGERTPEVTSGAAKGKLPWESTAASTEVPASPFANAMIQRSVVTTDTSGALKGSENRQDSLTPFGPSFTKQPSDHSGNNTKRMIRANGGASTPPFGKLTDPLDSQRQSRPPLERPMAPPGRHTPPRNIPPTRAGPTPTRKSPQKSYLDDDDEEDGSIVQKMMKALPGIPRFSFFRRKQFDSSASATWDAWNAGDSDTTEASAGFFGRIFGSKGGRRSSPKAPHQPSTKLMSPPLRSFMDRCDDGKGLSLLKPTERTRSRSIGRTLAALDTVALVFALIGLKQLPKLEHIMLPHSLSEAFRGSLPQFAHCVVAGMDTWAPFAFLAAFLTMQTRQLILKAKLRSLMQTLDASISEEAQYGALFLRLYTSSSFVRDVSERLRKAANSQLTARIDLTRLRALVTIFLVSMFLMTVPIFTPLMMALFGALQHIFDLKLLRSWPIEWKALMANIILSWSAFASTAKELIAEELEQMSGHPKQVVFGLSIAAALLLVSRLPVSNQRSMEAEVTETDEEEDAQFVKFTEQVSNLGISSASRIALLSDAGGIDSALERWRLLIPRGADLAYSRRSLKAILHITWKGLASAIILALPLLFEHYYSGFFSPSKGNAFPQWGSLMDVSCVLLLTQFVSWKALSSSLLADEYKGAVAGFVMSLRKATNERLSQLNAPPANLPQQVAISPSAGLEVKDLWAAHTTKRAWAVRGVSLECRSGNVLLILGDDSAGKSRLLTTLAETIARPPPQALTTTRVRGSIRVAGIEVNQWDDKLLQKRVWPVLHDVRSMSDFAQVLSGMSLEEILEPSGGIRYLELSHRPGPNERATMILALKLVGLYSSLLPKLPSKLSTVVTANEEDTRPSALRPLYSMLSPAEWSKLLLARVFSQAIYENDNSASSSDNLENCLIGSLLLLDDATLYLPEVEEARLIRDLRATGAATILTSNRWALGRLADQIVVMRDGAILECGTHAELLSRGPQQSLYAAKWRAMTSQ
ncbi:hypothetical protein FisN_5Lh308 [Fistulifera solaris]|uniref:ABC transporter transmembrane region n=1 Tax=Fistulifera solaris TaxID=1519565 RepID=W0TUP2_FISSO|nr:ABC transporter transmembrane region [Fistulifera solaris]GAX25224.1 hypothetical protein FisN_5Lh308 [Fistulifera solaris]|eukprot:GAX25224.1 hypothetical protein FisN_5Lh308 [Fistulifera solaris]